MRRVTFHPAEDTNPAWSPDGSRIAFESWRGGFFPHIWMIRPPGGAAGAESAVEPDESLARIPFDTALQITQGIVIDEAPAWSPDGQFIVFGSRTCVGCQAELWVKRAQWGGSMTQLTFLPSYDRDPAWSPDGSQIAFGSGRSRNPDIWVIDVDGAREPLSLERESWASIKAGYRE